MSEVGDGGPAFPCEGGVSWPPYRPHEAAAAAYAYADAMLRARGPQPTEGET